MAPARDYYQILGVDRQATAQQIKTAYRKLALRYHPDKNPGDTSAEARFKEAAEAYAVLSDADKRRRYDQFGREGVSGGFRGFDPETFGDFSDILGEFFGAGFADLFGGRRRRGGSRPGADLRYELVLDLEEAAFGADKTLEVPRLETCGECSGSGAAGGGAPETCSMCGGRGQVRFTQGFFTMARTCPRCEGQGEVVSDPCSACSGAGRRERLRSIQVKIPAGVDTGTRLRLSGEGEHGRRGGRVGDLYVDVVLRRHPRFERRGADVLSEEWITYPQAVLGAQVEIDTLRGRHKLDVAPGTADGTVVELPRLGIDRLDRGGRGAHRVTVRVRVPHPRELSEEHLDAIRAQAEIEGSPVKGERKVLDRVRDLFG